MSQEKLQTMSMQNFWGVKEVHYGIVQVVNVYYLTNHVFWKEGGRELTVLGIRKSPPHTGTSPLLQAKH